MKGCISEISDLRRGISGVHGINYQRKKRTDLQPIVSSGAENRKRQKTHAKSVHKSATKETGMGISHLSNPTVTWTLTGQYNRSQILPIHSRNKSIWRGRTCSERKKLVVKGCSIKVDINPAYLDCYVRGDFRDPLYSNTHLGEDACYPS
jgi:hypothetical protein